MNPNELRSRRLYSDILASFSRKQHLNGVQVLLCHFLAALGQPRLNSATVKSPSAISRFLNHYDWNLRAVVRIMRRHALEQYFEYRQQFRGRRPRLELIVDLTSLGKEGQFTALTGWMHTLNGVHGVHVVILFLCCGTFRLPWSFLIWRGKGQPSPAMLALRLCCLTSCSLSFQDEQCVLEGIEGLQLKFECLPTDLRHEREPYGPRQIAPIRPGAWRFDRQRQVLQMA